MTVTDSHLAFSTALIVLILDTGSSSIHDSHVDDSNDQTVISSPTSTSLVFSLPVRSVAEDI